MANTLLTNKHTFLSFRLGKEYFALSVKKVLEVLQEQKITEVPQTPEYIKGIINFRGEILPVIDTRLKFNMSERDKSEEYVIIVLDLVINDQNIVLGAIADGVKDVFEVLEKDIKAAPEFGNNYNNDFLDGMIKVDDRFIMILSIDKVFSVEELTILMDISDTEK